MRQIVAKMRCDWWLAAAAVHARGTGWLSGQRQSLDCHITSDLQVRNWGSIICLCMCPCNLNHGWLMEPWLHFISRPVDSMKQWRWLWQLRWKKVTLLFTWGLVEFNRSVRRVCHKNKLTHVLYMLLVAININQFKEVLFDLTVD